MTNLGHLPRYEKGDIHTYISQLRKYIFFAQQDAADHFRLDRSRISRYESVGEPDDASSGYIASLIKLVAERHKNTLGVQEVLVADANSAFLEYTRHEPFLDWEMLCDKANIYLEKQHRNYVEKWIVKNFPKKLSKADQIDLLKSRVGPVSYQEFIGMHVELHDLRQLLLTPGPPWIIAITGLGGIGKTSLAHALTYAVIHEQLFDNVGWIRVRQNNNGFEKWRRASPSHVFDIETLFDQLLYQLVPNIYRSTGIPNLNSLELLQTRLTQIPHLIVIDNLETLNGIDDLIFKLQSLTNPTKFLLTSRINLPDEPTVYPYPLSGLARADAIALMRREAALRNTPSIETADDNLLGKIYDVVDGNPLVLRMVVGQASSNSVKNILAELSQIRGQRNEALFEFIFASAWQNLNQRAHILLLSMLLSTNHGAAPDYLAAITKLPVEMVRTTFDQLIALNLVNHNNATEYQLRYTIHNLARAYLHYITNLSISDYVTLIHTTLANSLRYMQQRVQQAEGLLSTEDHEQSLHTLRYALEVLELWPVTRMLLLELAPKMEQAGFRDEWVLYLIRGIRVSKHLRDYAAEAEIRFHLGTLHQRRSDYLLAYSEFSLAAEIFSKVNQPYNQAKTLNRKAYVARLQRNFPQANDLANQGLALLGKNDTERAYSLLVLGTVQLDLRDFEGAEALFQQALEIWTRANNQRMMAWCLTNLGAVLRPLERYQEAMTAYQRAIEFFEEAQDPVHLASAWMNLGNVNLMQGDPTKALNWYEQAQDVFIQVQEKLRLTHIQMNMGMAHYQLEQWENAESFFSRCIEGYEAIGNVERVANGMDALGLTFINQHRYAEAIKTFQDAIDKLTVLEHRVSYATLLEELETHLQEAIQVYETENSITK